MEKKIFEIIEFFKMLGLYDEKAFDYILTNLKLDYGSNKRYDKEIEGVFLTFDDEEKLTDFKLYIPIYKDKYSDLIYVYLFAKALNTYNKLGEKLEYDNLSELLPLTLVRIYTVLYLNKKDQLILSRYEYDELKKVHEYKEKYLIGYNLQFDTAEGYFDTNTILIPNEFFVDDERAAIKFANLKSFTRYYSLK